jgi:hypothetical protein
MRYTAASASRAELDERMRPSPLRRGRGLNRLRKHVAVELFLQRLVAVARGRWVLTAALALDFRLSVPTRPTKDIDLGRADDEKAAIEDITAGQQLALYDFSTFTTTRTNDPETRRQVEQGAGPR